MKKLLLSVVILASISVKLIAQVNTGNVGVGTISPQPDAILDISSNSRGLLIPSLGSQAINDILATYNQVSYGLLVFNTDDSLFYYNSSDNLLSPRWVTFPFKKCPTNFIAVGNEFCIQANQSGGSSPQTWEAAVANCQNLAGNAHLCSWSEWFSACQTNSPSIFNMTNGVGEWIDDATSPTQALVGGSTSGDCIARTESLTSTQKAFRCCYRR